MTDRFYFQPRRIRTESGEIRRMGAELEFAGIEFKEVIRAMEQFAGARAVYKSQAECSIGVPGLGSFLIEVDSKFAKHHAEARAASRPGKVEDDPLAEWVVSMATEIVPLEVVCPPVAISELQRLDRMVECLREAGALGTQQALHYAFGLHLNPELPGLDALTISRYLKAYALAQDWLLVAHRVDLARRITPYIDVYPRAYLRRVLSYDDDVMLDTLVEDYLHHNPSRNRALDMLPLFKHLRPALIEARVDDERVKARPTFHYRLPNCEIERADWYLDSSWNIWCVVEQLADDPDLLQELAGQWMEYEGKIINFGRPTWHATLHKLHRDLLSA